MEYRGPEKKTEQKALENAKQTRSKREANAMQTPSKREANAMQEQEQEQEQEQYAISYTATRPTLNQFVAAVKVAGIDEESARGIWQELEEAGWADKDGRPVANWRRYAKTTYNERKKNAAARENMQGSQDGRYVDLEGVE